MTYCLGIVTKHGLVMASDSRSNAGYDQVNTCCKMHTFERPGERVFVVLPSGSLSCTQSVITLLRRDFDAGNGLADAPTMYDAARAVGRQMRVVADLDRAALERDNLTFNVHVLLGGQIRGGPPQLFLIYPQGNPLEASVETPFLQIGEIKYGRPILDRGIRFGETTLEDAAKYALLSLDSTMRSNLSVGPPINLLAYVPDSLRVTHHRRFDADDPDLQKIRMRWDQAIRNAVQRLPGVRFRSGTLEQPVPLDEATIELVDAANGDGSAAAEQLSQRQPPRPSRSPE